MKAIEEYPIIGRSYSTTTEFRPIAHSAYIFGLSVEERSAHTKSWMRECDDIEFVRISDQSISQFSVLNEDTKTEYRVRSQKDLTKFVNSLQEQRVYLDITGLDHCIWAPILKFLLLLCDEVVVAYVEPRDYRPSAMPTEGVIFDLSERIQGISPIPGFITLGTPRDEMVCFVPMLGFEGARFGHVIEQVQPLGEKIIPIIGVPGFRPEHPFSAYLGNRTTLLESRSWRNIRFAAANCPFSAYYLLKEIHNDYPNHTLKIAPIGTKPHALGAVLYCLSKSSPGPIEIIYDHPIRKAQRSEGTARLLTYNVSYLFKGTS